MNTRPDHYCLEMASIECRHKSQVQGSFWRGSIATCNKILKTNIEIDALAKSYQFKNQLELINEHSALTQRFQERAVNRIPTVVILMYW